MKLKMSNNRIAENKKLSGDCRKGFVTTLLADDKGNILHEAITKNEITYEGADAIARMIGQDSEYAPTFMYGEHAPGGTYTEGVLPPLTTDKSDTVATLRSGSRDTVDAEVAIPRPTFSTSDGALYQNNVLNFQGSFGDSNIYGRQFVGAGLVARVGAQEILVAHSYYPAQTVNTGQTFFVLWSINIL